MAQIKSTKKTRQMKGSRRIKYLVLVVAIVYNLFLLYLVFSTIDILIVSITGKQAIQTIVFAWLYKIVEWPLVIIITVSAYVVVLKHYTDKEEDIVNKGATITLLVCIILLFSIYFIYEILSCSTAAWAYEAAGVRELFAETISVPQALAILIFTVAVVVIFAFCCMGCTMFIAGANFYDVFFRLKYVAPKAYDKDDEKDTQQLDNKRLIPSNSPDSQFDSIDVKL